jgi:TetR/AcrR family transcriptional repressor of nem operon
MAEAGLTAGGFYSHFDSKEALFAEAMTTALDPGKALRVSRGASAGVTDPLASLIKGYLSRTHRDTVGEGCPLPALTSDVARKSDLTRESYELQFLRFVEEIETLLPGCPAPARERALAIVAQCVGGLMLARAVKNEKLSDQILKSCRSAALAICNTSAEPTD